MSESYHTTPMDRKPSVFGMTTSLVNWIGVSSQINFAIKIRNLDSIVFKIKDHKELACLAACKKSHEMEAFSDMLFPNKGSGKAAEKANGDDEGIANLLQRDSILSDKETCDGSKLFHLYMYSIKCVNSGSSNDPFLSSVSEFAVLFVKELDAEVLLMSVDLFIARAMITKASLVFKGSVNITESQLASLKIFHVRLMSIVLDVDVDPSTTQWDAAKAYMFAPVVGDMSVDPVKEIDWDLVEQITNSDAWANPLQRARPDVYLSQNGIREIYGLVPSRVAAEMQKMDFSKEKLVMADGIASAEDLVGRVVTIAAYSAKRFYVDSVCYEMTAETSLPKKKAHLEYRSYADYYKQRYGVELFYKQQPLIRGRKVSCCKNFLSPRFEHSEGQSEDALDKIKYVFLPPELCLVHPLPGSLVRGAQRLPSIMRRVESLLLAVELKKAINYSVPASKILEALTAASCQEAFCYGRLGLLGNAYLKWVVSRFLFLKYPQKDEGQLSRMRQQMVSYKVLYQFALNKGLQSYIQTASLAPCRWAVPGVLPVFDVDRKDGDSSLFDEEPSHTPVNPGKDDEMKVDSSSYRVLSGKTLADVVQALIGVYYVEGGKNAANHLMKWIGFQIESDLDEMDPILSPACIPESILKSAVNFDVLERALNFKFEDPGLLVEAITHSSHPSSRVSCYQRLEFLGDAVLDHLITMHLFFTYTNLPSCQLTDLRIAAVTKENFARVAVKRKLHVHLRHSSREYEKEIRDFIKKVEHELSKPGFSSFGLGDREAPKVLSDIVESIAGAIFLDSGRDTAVVWKVFQPLLHPMVTPEMLPMHPVRELQERCQQQAADLKYKVTTHGNSTTVKVFINGVQVAVAENPVKKMAQKLAARNALAVLKGKAESKEKNSRETLNIISQRKNWPPPYYRCIHEDGPAHAKRFTYAVRVNADECIGEPMPSVKEAKDSAATVMLQLLNKSNSN